MSSTVPDVKMSPDLKLATAYVMPLGGRDVKPVMEALERNRKLLRTEVAHRISMKFAPDIRFKIDQSFEYGAKIDAPARYAEGEAGPRQGTMLRNDRRTARSGRLWSHGIRHGRRDLLHHSRRHDRAHAGCLGHARPRSAMPSSPQTVMRDRNRSVDVGKVLPVGMSAAAALSALQAEAFTCRRDAAAASCARSVEHMSSMDTWTVTSDVRRCRETTLQRGRVERKPAYDRQERA